VVVLALVVVVLALVVVVLALVVVVHLPTYANNGCR